MVPITPAAAPTFPATQNSPANGDPLDATQLRNDIETPFLDGIEAARLLLYGGGFRRTVSATSNTVMVIQPLGAVVVKVGTAWQTVAHTVATTIDPLALAGGAFAPSTRYYVYVSVVANAIVWSVSTTAPDANRRYKAGDEQYQFITTFYTNAAFNLLTYKQDDRQYSYTMRSGTGGGTDGNLFLDIGVATFFTTVPLGPSVPSGATNIIVHGTSIANAGGAYVQMGSGGTLGIQGTQLTLTPLNVVATYFAGQFTIMTGTDMDYLVDAVTTTAFAWVAGFTY